jgi:hypothetical protein
MSLFTDFGGRHFRKLDMALLFLWPDVLALFQWTEDAIPGRLEIEQRYVEHEHWIVWAAPRLQKLPPLSALACFSLVKVR